MGTIPVTARLMAGLQLWSTFIFKADDVVVPFGCVNYLFVAIVEAEIDERFHLDNRVKPAVIHTKRDQIDLVARYRAFWYCSILFVEVVGKSRAKVYLLSQSLLLSHDEFQLLLGRYHIRPPYDSDQIPSSLLSYCGNWS